MLKLALVLLLSHYISVITCVRIYVILNGTNDKTCLNGHMKCRTLEYVLQNLSVMEANGSAVEILVGYNQTLANSTVKLSGNTTLIVKGTIACTLLQAPEECAAVNLDVSNVHFIGKESSATPVEKGIVEIASFRKTIFNNCTFSNGTSLVIRNIQDVQVIGCQFLLNYFSDQLLSLIYEDTQSILSKNSYTISVINCVFEKNTAFGISDYRKISSLVSVLGVHLNTTEDANYSTIVVYVAECTFSSNNLVAVSRSSAFSVDILNSFNQTYLTLSKCHFNHNNGRVIYVKSNQHSTRHVVVNAHDNVIENSNVPINELFALVSFWFGTKKSDVGVSVLFENNIITRSNGTGFRFVVARLTETASASLFLANSNLSNINGPAMYAICTGCVRYQLNVSILETSFSDNIVPNPRISSVTITNCNLYLSNTNFTNNFGTGVALKNVDVTIFGTLVFDGNVGLKGGGCYIGPGVVFNVNGFIKGVFLIFKNNVAIYGGGLYITSSSNSLDGTCNTFNASMIPCQPFLETSNNTATVAGNNVYLQKPWIRQCVTDINNIVCDKVSTTEFASAATSISFNGTNSTCKDSLAEVNVFPGQDIDATVEVLDAYSHSSTCVANVFLQCGEEFVVCKTGNGQVQLHGPGEMTLTNNQRLSPIQIESPNGNLPFCPMIVFQCQFSRNAVLAININSCPLGFLYNVTSRVCQCALENSKLFQCSRFEGVACVSLGYWYGEVNDSNTINSSLNVISPCQYSFCSPQFVECTLSIKNSTSYILLPKSQDEQCGDNHGSVLCRECMPGAAPSFQATLCVINNDCKNWQPYVLLVLAILFQVVLSVLVVFFMRYIRELGFLYGPLFYVAVVNHLPFRHYLQLYQLNLVVSIFSSELLLNLSAFGYIPWCFFDFKSYNTLINFAFQFLGPLISATILVSIIGCARRCPHLYIRWKITPVQTICILALLSFWTVTDTSIEILKAQTFPGLSKSFVYVQPSIPYFTGAHIPLVLASVAILGIMIIPVIIVLLLAPLVGKKFNLSRLQPFLDVFQSSFKDKFRWYPAVYFIAWILFLSTNDYSPITSQLVLILMASIHFLLQPFKKNHHNVTNSLLLSDLVLINSFINEETDFLKGVTGSSQTYLQAVVYILTLSPLVYFIVTVGAILLHKTGFAQRLKQAIVSKRKHKILISNMDDDSSNLARLDADSALVVRSSSIALKKIDYTRLRESLLESFH